MTTPVRHEEPCVPFYREYREPIYKCLQKIAEKGKHLPRELYQYKRGKDRYFRGADLTTKFTGSTMTEALLVAVEYFRKNCKRYNGKEEDILQIPVECLYEGYRYYPHSTVEELTLPSCIYFHKVE